MENLYKRTKTGAIQEWTIKVHNETIPRIEVTQGQFDGKMQVYPELIPEGKQKRNALEQAEFQANSQWKGKLDNGYKSATSLGWNYDLNLSRADLLRFLTAKLPLDSTDANGNKKPMLASKKITKAVYPAYLQTKLNGVRCLIFARLEKTDMFSPDLFSPEPPQVGDTVGLNIHAISREGKSYDFATHKIRKALIPFFILNPDVILDGELYCHGKALQDISGAVRKEEYIPARHDHIQYHIYDVGVDMIQLHRHDFLQTEVKPHVGELIRLVPFHIVNSEEEVFAKHKEFTADGYEGAILRNYTGIYHFGKRSNDLIKVKEFQDAEYEIAGWEFGKRGMQDLMFIMKQDDKKQFRSTPVGTIAEKTEYARRFEAGELVGKMATIKFFEFSNEMTPLHSNMIEIRDYE